jgi:hypothetical protein
MTHEKDGGTKIELKNSRSTKNGQNLGGFWMYVLAILSQIVYLVCRTSLADESEGNIYKGREGNVELLTDHLAICKLETNELTTVNAMSSRSVPSISGRWPRSMLTDSGRDVSDLGTPLVSPLTPLPAEVLDRARKGTFGPEDLHPKEGTVIRRVQAAMDELWVKHRKGVDLIARPGSIVFLQTLYTGKE